MIIKEKLLRQIIKENIMKVETKQTTRWKEVKYFHPEGRNMPNGSHYQRGGYIQECKQNINSFILDEGVHNNQYGLSDYRGGVIVFSTDVKDTMLHDIMNYFNAKGGECIGAYSVGNFFIGKYVGDNGEMYNEKSLSVEINGLSSKSLLNVAEMIAREFKQETVLVKDLSKNKIYLADSISSL